MEGVSEWKWSGFSEWKWSASYWFRYLCRDYCTDHSAPKPQKLLPSLQILKQFLLSPVPVLVLDSIPNLACRLSFQCATPTCWQTTQIHNFWLWGTGALCCACGLCCSHKSVVADMGIIDCLAVHSTSRFLTGETGPVNSTSICSVNSLEQACCQYTPPLSQCLGAAEAISFVANKVFPVKAAM